MNMGMSPKWNAPNFPFSAEKNGLGHSCGHPYFETSPYFEWMFEYVIYRHVEIDVHLHKQSQSN